MIRGVLFDMDGLMFDTERIGHRGWKYGAQVLGLELPDEVIAAGRGMSVADSRAMYLERLARRWTMMHCVHCVWRTQMRPSRGMGCR